jgi:hypothetical protein
MLRSTVGGRVSQILLEAVPLSTTLVEKLLKLVGQDPEQKYTRHTSTLGLSWEDIIGLMLIWAPTPEIAHQAIRVIS